MQLAVFRSPDLIRNLTDPAVQDIVEGSLPEYLTKQRWFSSKDQRILRSGLRNVALLNTTDPQIAIAEVEVQTAGGISHWLVPLALIWSDGKSDGPDDRTVLLRVRSSSISGFLVDAVSIPQFGTAFVAALNRRATIDTQAGSIEFRPTAGRHTQLNISQDAKVRRSSTEQSNSSLVMGDSIIIKILRKVSAGVHPEAEMNQFLTHQGFTNTPALLGEVVRVSAGGERHTLAVAQAYVSNEGDAWAFFLKQFRAAAIETAKDRAVVNVKKSDLPCNVVSAAIGRRLREMHALLSQPRGDPEFGPEIAGEGQARSWKERAEKQVLGAFRSLEKAVEPGSRASTYVEQLRARKSALSKKLRDACAKAVGTHMIRIHGDFHLGQVLVAEKDVYIIDFEGEPGRPLIERRGKDSPLRDVAGLLRSFDYAAAKALDEPELRDLPSAVDVIGGMKNDAQTSFLSAYFAAADERYATPELLDLFLIEKAAYEITYEVANRPHWIPIPVEGLCKLIDGPNFPGTTRSNDSPKREANRLALS